MSRRTPTAQTAKAKKTFKTTAQRPQLLRQSRQRVHLVHVCTQLHLIKNLRTASSVGSHTGGAMNVSSYAVW